MITYLYAWLRRCVLVSSTKIAGGVTPIFVIDWNKQFKNFCFCLLKICSNTDTSRALASYWNHFLFILFTGQVQKRFKLRNIESRICWIILEDFHFFCLFLFIIFYRNLINYQSQYVLKNLENAFLSNKVQWSLLATPDKCWLFNKATEIFIRQSL